MSATQVITIAPDGSIVSLDHKRKGLALRTIGKAEIKRVTLIEWSEDRQQWFIRWTDHVIHGNQVWTNQTVENAGLELPDFELIECDADGVLYLHDYEDAVSVEVAVIQAMQRSGEVIH